MTKAKYNELRHDIGDTLRALRKSYKREDGKVGLSVSQLCQKINITDACYRKYESGERGIPLDVMKALCEFFDCDIDYLFYHREFKRRVIANIHERTGLSQEAIDALQDNKHNVELNYYDSLNWLLCNGLLDIVKDLYNIRALLNWVRMDEAGIALDDKKRTTMSIPQDIYALSNEIFQEVYTDSHYMTDSRGSYIQYMVRKVAPMSIDQLRRYKKSLDSMSVQNEWIVFEPIQRDWIVELRNYDTGEDTISDEVYELIMDVCRKLFRCTYSYMSFQYSLESKKYTISQKFANMLDGYLKYRGIETDSEVRK